MRICVAVGWDDEDDYEDEEAREREDELDHDSGEARLCLLVFAQCITSQQVSQAKVEG